MVYNILRLLNYISKLVSHFSVPYVTLGITMVFSFCHFDKWNVLLFKLRHMTSDTSELFHHLSVRCRCTLRSIPLPCKPVTQRFVLQPLHPLFSVQITKCACSHDWLLKLCEESKEGVTFPGSVPLFCSLSTAVHPRRPL